MATYRVQRKLAAILATDMVGYSRLMGEDETKTLAALKSHRKNLIDPEIAEAEQLVAEWKPGDCGAALQITVGAVEKS